MRNSREYASNRPTDQTAFDVRALKKLHLQLKHGTHSAMRNWTWAADKWSAELDRSISEFLFECKCKKEEVPLPHPVTSMAVPVGEKQTVFALHVIYLEGIPCLHIVEKCTGWSETAVLKHT